MFVPDCMYVYHVMLDPIEASRGARIPWTWSGRWLRAEPGSSTRAINSRALSRLTSPIEFILKLFTEEVDLGLVQNNVVREGKARYEDTS